MEYADGCSLDSREKFDAPSRWATSSTMDLTMDWVVERGLPCGIGKRGHDITQHLSGPSKQWLTGALSEHRALGKGCAHGHCK